MELKNQNSSFIAKLASKCDFIHEREFLQILFEFGIIQISYLVLCLYTFGFMYGIIVGLVGYYLFAYIMDCLGYVMINGIDVISAIDVHPHIKRNCTENFAIDSDYEGTMIWVIAYFKLGKIKTEELRDKYFMNLGVKKFRRFRQIWIRRFGFWFLKDVDPELARNQVKRIDADIHTEKELFEYQAKLTSNEFNMDKPLWEVHVVEDYDENTSIMFIVVHHIIADGMSMISLMTFMNDNHNADNIIQYRDIPFLYYYIMPIFYIPYGVIRYIVDAIKVKGDPNMYPFVLKTGKQSMIKEYTESKYYELADIKKCYNHFGKMKLNDFMFASISAAFSKYFVELGIPEDKQTYFGLSIPINMKPQPRNIDDVKINNLCSLCVARIPLSSNIDYIMKKNRETFDHGFTLTALCFGLWVVSSIGIFPEAITRFVMKDNCKSLNIIISNTPGPQTPIYFCDQQVYDMGGIGPNVGCSGITLLISSYCNKVKIQILTDSNLGMDPKKFIKYLEAQLDESIMKYGNKS